MTVRHGKGMTQESILPSNVWPSILPAESTWAADLLASEECIGPRTGENIGCNAGRTNQIILLLLGSTNANTSKRAQQNETASVAGDGCSIIADLL
jgi:hypothetical protein